MKKINPEEIYILDCKECQQIFEVFGYEISSVLINGFIYYKVLHKRCEGFVLITEEEIDD